MLPTPTDSIAHGRCIRELPVDLLRVSVDRALTYANRKWPYYPGPLSARHYARWLAISEPNTRTGPFRSRPTLRHIRGVLGPLFTGFDYVHMVRVTDALDCFCLGTEFSPHLFPVWSERTPEYFVRTVDEWLRCADEGPTRQGVCTRTGVIIGLPELGVFVPNELRA